jgi:hypothetical protein
METPKPALPTKPPTVLVRRPLPLRTKGQTIDNSKSKK